MKKRFVLGGIACALLVGAPLAIAGSSASLNQFKHHTLPVLVSVDSHGVVTDMTPAYTLQPRMRKLLETTLDQVITGPAKRDGKAVSSQSVIQFAVNPVEQADGQYKVQLAYVKAMPVPHGPWFWNHIDGHRLALQRRHVFDRSIMHQNSGFDRFAERQAAAQAYSQSVAATRSGNGKK